MQKLCLICFTVFLGCGSDFFVEIQMNPPEDLQNIQLSRIEVQINPIFTNNAPSVPGVLSSSFSISFDEDNDGEPLTLPSSYALRFPLFVEDTPIEELQQFELIQVGFAFDDPNRPVVEAATVVTVDGNPNELAQFRFVADEINCNSAIPFVFPCYDLDFLPGVFFSEIAVAPNLQNEPFSFLFALDSDSGEVVKIRFEEGVPPFFENNFPTNGVEPTDIVLGNFSGLPNQIEFAAVNTLSNDVAILDSGGGVNNFIVGQEPIAIRSGFLDVGPEPDLVVANRLSQSISGLFFFLGSPTPDIFEFNVPGEPKAIALDNFFGDNQTDIAVLSQLENGEENLVILENLGGRNFSTVPQDSNLDVIGVDPVAIASTQIDFDDLPDLLVLNRGTRDLRILLNNGDGSFRLHKSLPLPGEPSDLAVADIDGNALEDAVVTLLDGRLLIFSRFEENTQSLSFGIGREFSIGQDALDLEIGDIAGSGFPDLIIAAPGKSSIDFLITR